MAISTSTTSEMKTVRLAQGTIRYQDEGSGPVLVFIHGLLAQHMLWQEVIPRLAPKFRCIAPDLPLGSHSLALNPDADLSPPGLARLIADFIEALDLREVTLVGNDTGGALCQLTITQHPKRIARLVLTNCDAFENFLPPAFRVLTYGARLFGRGFAVQLAWLLRSRLVQRQVLASVAFRQAPPDQLNVFFQPIIRNAGVRRDVTKVLKGISNRYTLEAARNFSRVQQPVLLIWGKNDPFFPPKFAMRLQQAFPAARLEFLGRSRAFVPMDQPERLADYIQEFAHGEVPLEGGSKREF